MTLQINNNKLTSQIVNIKIDKPKSVLPVPCAIGEIDVEKMLQASVEILETENLDVFSVACGVLGLQTNDLFSTTLKTGNEDLALEFLAKGLVNLKGKDGQKVFMDACDCGSVKIIDTLIKSGISLKGLGEQLLKVIVERTDGKRTQIMKLLVASGALDLEERDGNGDTYFLKAVKEGDIKLAALLIASVANINATDKKGMTALTHLISQNNLHQEMIQLLLSHHADIHKSKDADSALRAACKSGCSKKVALVLNVSLERATKYLNAMKERILLAHVNSISGDFEGNLEMDSAAFVMKALKSMPDELMSILPSERAQLTTAGEMMLQRNSADIISSIQEGRLTLVPCGNKHHTIYLVFAKGYMAICNRSHAGPTITAYKINPKAFTKDIYRFILAESEDDKKDVGAYYITLPSLLSLDGRGNHIKDDVCAQLERLSPKLAKAGTCTYISAKTALRAAAAMMRINPDRTVLANKDLRAAKQFAKTFSGHARLVALDDFIAAGTDPNLDAELLSISMDKACKHIEKFPLLSEAEYQKKAFKHIKIAKNS